MIKDKMVSVIIPCYLQANYLDESIKSVLNQTYSNFEIIVVDDGSPDNVEEIVSNYSPVKLIKQANQGAAVARNHGVFVSRGAYLIFLDADDRLLPNALKTGVDYLNSFPECAFVSGLIQLIDAQGNFIEVPFQPTIQENHYQFLLHSNYIWTPGVVMYSREIITNEIWFKPCAGGAADYELNIRLARKYPIKNHGQIVLEYRQHGANMSGNFAYMLQSGVKVRYGLFKYVKRNRKLISALRDGIKIVQEDVGTQLVHQIRVKKRRIFKGIWCLILYYPKGIHLLIKSIIKSNFVKLKQNLIF